MPRTWVLLMAGGRGTRLWPKSKVDVPKQFMPLSSHPTLFQQALERIWTVTDREHIFVTVPPEYIPFITAQAPQLTSENMVVEPVQHGTTACLYCALIQFQTLSIQPDDVILIVPTDSSVCDGDQYLECITEAVEVAGESDELVTIGIRPSRPATGYGYIQVTADQMRGPAIRAKGFVEKPSYEQAVRYIREENYFWNAGIFAWKASAIWSRIKAILPSGYGDVEQVSRMFQEAETAAIRDFYLELPNVPFERAIVENESEIYMIPARFDWDDVGQWSSLIKTIGDSNEEQCVVRLDADNCLVENEYGLVALLGVQDLIVVHTRDTVLVCHQSREQDVKNIVELVRANGFLHYL